MACNYLPDLTADEARAEMAKTKAGQALGLAAQLYEADLEYFVNTGRQPNSIAKTLCFVAEWADY